MTKKTITNARVKTTLHKQFKEFLDEQNISNQIEKKIQEHSIKKGRIIEFYLFLDTALVELSNGKTVEAEILHRCYGGIIDLYTPEGEIKFSETKKEPCVIPKFYQKVWVANDGGEEYVILGYRNKDMTGSFNPANPNEYIIRSLSDTNQGGISVSPSNINISTSNDITFQQSDIGETNSIEYANSKNTYKKDEVYNKAQVDKLIKDIWDYIRPEDEEED